MCGGQPECRADAGNLHGLCSAQAGRDCREWHARRGCTEARDAFDSRCIRCSQRASGARVRRELGRPRGNITGFIQTDFSTVGKSVEMLKAMAPTLNSVGLMYNPETYAFYDAYLERFQAEGRWSMELKRVAVRVPPDIGLAVKDFASRAGAGLVVMVDAFAINQATIRRALEDYPLPHIVPWRSFVVSGGLMPYGPDVEDIFSPSADYVD